MSCAERKRFAKNCGLLAKEQVGDNKQKISPNLMKRTDFLVHKAQILVGVTGFEPAASTSKQNCTDFFLDLQGFSGLLSPKTMLSDALVRTIST